MKTRVNQIQLPDASSTADHQPPVPHATTCASCQPRVHQICAPEAVVGATEARSHARSASCRHRSVAADPQLAAAGATRGNLLQNLITDDAIHLLQLRQGGHSSGERITASLQDALGQRRWKAWGKNRPRRLSPPSTLLMLHSS
jgi:hypothetical protein